MLNYYLRNTQSLHKLFHSFGQIYFRNIDHIAVRTFQPSKMDKYFRNEGYKKMNDLYFFPQHKACATWYKSNNFIPRIFMSSYLGANYDVFDYNIIEKYKRDGLTYNQYLDVRESNQYLAWTLLFENKVNHLAFEVDNLESYCKVLVRNNYLLNDKENPIKISQDGLLKQASIVADKIPYKFLDGEHNVPYGFVEFVERKRDGFEENNANGIFNSTKA